MKIIIIDDVIGASIYKNWKSMKKVHSFEKEDFTEVSGDYILNTTGDSFEISKDIKLLERVASDKVFAKQKMSGVDMMTLGTFLLVLYSLISA